MNATSSVAPSKFEQGQSASVGVNTPAPASSPSDKKIQGVATHLKQSDLMTSLVKIKNTIIAGVSHALKIIIQLIRNVVKFIVDVVKGSMGGQTMADQKSNVIAPKTLILSELSQEFLNETFIKLEKQGLHSPEISHEIKILAEDPAFWRIWANQLAVPYDAQENPKDKILKLLSFFKIEPTTRRPTILQNIENINEALPLYPSAAYLISPILGTTQFNFYCRQPCGTIISYLNVDQNNGISESVQFADAIVSDDSYTALTLSNMPKPVKN
ncbi:MAG: hypothetical protein H0U49_11000 [Parachlamydiaceae bacterium]|nr:hypothetical protein [Parachlamydiaceae bacterium]